MRARSDGGPHDGLLVWPQAWAWVGNAAVIVAGEQVDTTNRCRVYASYITGAHATPVGSGRVLLVGDRDNG